MDFLRNHESSDGVTNGNSTATMTNRDMNEISLKEVDSSTSLKGGDYYATRINIATLTRRKNPFKN